MAEFDLKSPHVSCLYYIYKAESLTSKQLCDISAEDKAAISRSLDYLEKNGYLTHKISKNKRYKSQIVLTEKGRATAEIIANKVDSILDGLESSLSDEERVVMYKALSVISRNLDSMCEKNEL